MIKNNLPKAKKRFGQNFLLDPEVLQKIILTAEPSTEDTVLEIGTGTGILTAELAKTAGRVISVEIDSELYTAHSKQLQAAGNVQTLLGDFLLLAEEIFSGITARVKVIANIPYYITTPILEKLLDYREQISSITLLVQKEVADRICAEPGNKDYGSLTIFLQYYAETRQICVVPAEAFQPRPQVNSALIRLDVRPELKYRPLSEKRFFNIVRGAFWGRRKTLRNTLKQSPYTHYTTAMLDKITCETSIDLQRRGETLSIEEYVKLASVELSS